MGRALRVQVSAIILLEVQLLQLQESVDSLCGNPSLHDPIDDPREGIQGTDKDVEQSQARENLHIYTKSLFSYNLTLYQQLELVRSGQVGTSPTIYL